MLTKTLYIHRIQMAAMVTICFMFEQENKRCIEVWQFLYTKNNNCLSTIELLKITAYPKVTTSYGITTSGRAFIFNTSMVHCQLFLRYTLSAGLNTLAHIYIIFIILSCTELVH